jgi:hypothetical protein
MADVATPQRGELGRQLRPVHAVAGVCLAAAYAIGGPQALAVAATLALLEVMLSADTVLLNAAFLEGVARFWQRAFLTVGLLVTTVTVRFAAPLAVVCASARLSPAAAVRLLSADPERYRLLLATVQPYVGAFVGIFLLTVLLEFVFGYHDVARSRIFGGELHWRLGTRWSRTPLGRIGNWWGAELIALAVAIVAAATVPPDRAYKVLGAAVAGLATRYVTRRATSRAHFRVDSQRQHYPRAQMAAGGSVFPMTGRPAFGLLCSVELFNAVVSLDSTLTAFSLTLNAALICLGLLTGASYARSVSVHLARHSRVYRPSYRGHLDRIRGSDMARALAYVAYGRYQSAGLISVLMLVTVWRDVPGGLVCAIGIAVILVAVASSIWVRVLEKRKLLTEEARRRALQTNRLLRASETVRRLDYHPLLDERPRRAEDRRAGLAALHIYLADGREHAEVERAVEEWLADAGLEVVFRDDPIIGSWSRTLWVRVRTMARGQAAGEVAATVVRTLELRHYGVLDAQVTATLMQSTAQVLASLQNSKDAAIRLGAVLILKVDWVPVVTQLSAAQQLKLDHHPEMLDVPAQLLRFLGLDEADTPASGEQPRALGE